MKYVNIMIMTFAISCSLYAGEGVFEGQESGDQPEKPSSSIPVKEGWIAWAKRKGQETLSKMTPSTDIEPDQGDWDYKPTKPTVTQPVDAVGLHGVEPAGVKPTEAKNSATAITAKALGLHVKPTIEPTVTQPVEAVGLHGVESADVKLTEAKNSVTAITAKALDLHVEPTVEPTVTQPVKPVGLHGVEPAKSSAWQRLTAWFGDVGVGAKDFDIDLGDIEDDVKADLDFEGVTEQDLARIGKDTNLEEGCKLTEESLAKIKTIDSLLKSWTLAPFKKTFSFAFPIDAFADLVSEMATTEMIPVDVGVRLEAIIQDIPLMPKIIKTVTTAVGISIASSRTAAITYVASVIPALEGLAKVMPDYVKAQEIIANSSGKPVEILEKIVEAKIESLQKLPLKELLKATENATKAPEKALKKSKRINRVVTNVAVVLFALSVGVLALCIADWGKENRQFHKVVEIVGPLILVGLTGGIFYGSIRASRRLAEFDQPGASTVKPTGEPAGI